MRIWDTAATEPDSTTTPRTRYASAVAFSPDGTWLSTVNGGGAVRIWDAATGRQRATLTGRSGPGTEVAIAPDGTWLATAGDDGTVQIWDRLIGLERATLTGHPPMVDAMAIAADSTWLPPSAATKRCGSGMRPPDGSAPHSPARPRRCTCWPSPRTAPGWPPPTAVRIWDAATGRERATFTAHSGAGGGAGHRPGQHMAGQRQPRRDGADLGHAHRTGARHPYRPLWPRTPLAIAPDSTWLAAVGQDGTVRIWDATTGKQRAVPHGPAERSARSPWPRIAPG